jgi:chemotaxis protein histidine kinase CheA
MSEKTQEQLDAEAASKAQKQAEKEAKAAAAAEAKAAKQAEREAKKAAADAEKEAKKAEREAAKQAKLDAKEAAKAEREAVKAAKEQAKADAKAAKEANRQPEQNGIRRPGPDGLCGQVWGLADRLSAELGQAVPIANLLESGVAAGLNPSNIRTEYARWKKFHGLSGRIVIPTATSE